MSAATIAEPFLLSSYPESSAHRKHSAEPVYASLPSSSDADPFVTIAVQGDGVHVLDTSTLHSATSHTLGPSTSFACPPASRTTHRNGTRVCTTYAVLESGPEVQSNGKGKTVAMWEEPVSGGTASTELQREKTKKVAVDSSFPFKAPHSVAQIYAPEYLRDAEVLVGPAGEVSVADKDLHVQHTFTPQNHQASKLLKNFLFQSSTCTFLPPHSTSSLSSVSVSFLRSGNVSRVSVVGVSEDGSLQTLGECAVPVEESDVVDISCSNTGFISILSPTKLANTVRSGTWHALSLSTSPSSSLSIVPAAESLRLQALTFTSPARIGEASLSAITSSHVLLAAIATGSQTELVLLLWDLRYGVLLAQQAIPVPSTLPRPKKTGAFVRLTASPAPAQDSKAGKVATVQMNGLLVLAPAPDRDVEADNTPARSTILVVPLSVPATSTIAAAIGRANAGARWLLNKPAPAPQGQGRTGAPEISLNARKALNEMKASINGSAGGSVAGAETAFFEYVQQQKKGKGKSAAAQEEGRVAPLEYAFAQGALQLVLPPASAQTQNVAAYSTKVVRHLLERRAVSSSMVDGGLLPALAAQNDWDTIALAMRTVSDLPEADIISLLSKVVAAHRRASSSGDDNAMQVDPAPASGPSLEAFLAQCVVYPFTPAAERVALRKHLSDALDIVPVLEVLDGWLTRHSAEDTLVADASSAAPSSLPPLDKVLAFLQTLLDASFLALLSHTPAHALLRALAAHVEPVLATTSALENLCGPLEPFARAAAKAQQQQQQQQAKDAQANAGSGRDWRRKRKMAHEQAAIAVGLYQVEELVL
ncbi:hypothetical protein GY45DRAFT_1336311 [Cubamyces sp. BRFM 1775]|nr:hypothetical protein GY45DRAFT_1336311 [Cubamyces sp. BRFM 1775]